MHILREVLLELLRVTYAWLSKRPAFAALAGVAAVGLVLALGWALISRVFFTTDTDPYSYRRVSGAVLYEDGDVIPAESLNLTFIPMTPPRTPRLHPRPGFAVVDTKTGAFRYATSRKPGDGLVKGAHKVLISGDNRRPLPEAVVPTEYANYDTTPLEVDTKNGTFHLKVKRPAPTPKKADPKPKQ